MPDLKILEKDGYEEVEAVNAAIKDGGLDIKALWTAVARGDTDQAAIILFEAGLDVGEQEVEGIRDVVLVCVPDSVLGEFYRVWVKLVEHKKRHVCGDTCRSRGCKWGSRSRGPK